MKTSFLRVIHYFVFFQIIILFIGICAFILLSGREMDKVDLKANLSREGSESVSSFVGNQVAYFAISKFVLSSIIIKCDLKFLKI